MAQEGLRKVVFGLAATGLLIGCVEGGGETGATGSQVSAPATRAAGGAARDIEAPEIYQTSDSALWDGRPSLGGIWVAAPDAANPERVVIFNPATGKSITGALFKRERENPGPRLQLSSDAAEALGILAGQPTEIRVTALRKEEVKEPEPAAETPATDAAAAPAGEGTEAAAIATATLAAVDAGQDGAAAAAGAAETTGEAATVAAEGAAALAPDAPPKKKTWKERRAEAKAAREAKRRAAAEAKAAAAAGTATADGETATGAPDAAAAAVAPVETAPLDARDPQAVAAEAPQKPKRKTVGTDPAPVAAAEPAAEAPAATGTARPIQVASFSKEENARRATEALAKIGITASPQKSGDGAKAVWGVVVMGDAVMLKKIKDAGFADAYFLK